LYCTKYNVLGGAVASWLVRSSPERVVRVRALAGNIVLCSWARHLTLTVPLSTQVYKWVPVNCWGKPNKLRGNDLRWTSILSRGSRNTPSRFMLQKPGISSGSYGPLRIERLHIFLLYYSIENAVVNKIDVTYVWHTLERLDVLRSQIYTTWLSYILIGCIFYAWFNRV